MTEATQLVSQLVQPRSDVPPQPTVSSIYQPSAPPLEGLPSSSWNDPPVVVKTKNVIMHN